MCLQWCHVTHQLIDNDLPCDHCPPATRFAFDGTHCGGCRHKVLSPMGIRCRLTHAPIPRQACCHYDCSPDEPESGWLGIGVEQLAPGLLDRYGVETAAALFDESDTAPDYRPDGGAILVPLADLAVPLVYGLTANAWEEAL